jgi:hypothetical protein
MAAIKEIADRLDGKVPQLIGGDDESGPVRLAKIERVIVQALPVEKVVEHQPLALEEHGHGHGQD